MSRPTLGEVARWLFSAMLQNRELHRTLPSNLRASGAANACEGALSLIFGHAFDAASIAALEAEERAAVHGTPTLSLTLAEQQTVAVARVGASPEVDSLLAIIDRLCGVSSAP